jgi:hypothetical protein
MKRNRVTSLLASLVAAALCLAAVACTPLEQSARNTAAALGGAIGAAQAEYGAQCTKSPTDASCKIINQAVAGQNALVTAVEAYCGWSTQNPPRNGAATCVPVKSAADGLAGAIANANLLIAELKGLMK